MVTGKRLPLDDNLGPPFPGPVRRVETCHQHVDVLGQRTHHGHFARQRAHDGGHVFGAGFGRAQPRARQRVVKMTVDTARCPDAKLLIQQAAGALGLRAERVSAEVETRVRGVCGV